MALRQKGEGVKGGTSVDLQVHVEIRWVVVVGWGVLGNVAERKTGLLLYKGVKEAELDNGGWFAQMCHVACSSAYASW